MTAIVLPDLDRSTLEELKKRFPDLSEFELPNLPTRKEMSRAAKDVGKTADQTIDRLLGRSRAPVWPWIAAGIGLIAVAGIVAAWFVWFRRPTWEAPAETPAEPWTTETYDVEQTTMTAPIETMPSEPELTEPSSASTRGTSARDRSRSSSTSGQSMESVASAPYPIEEA
jgi:hypothetical protein